MHKLNNKIRVHTLIVGQGIAGSLLGWELHRLGKSVMVCDEGKLNTSSKIAAGMFNPINTKRFTVTANPDEAFKVAMELYHSIETVLNIHLIHHSPIYNVFGNIKESNDYSLKLDHPFFAKYTNPNPLIEPHINQPFGAFEVGLSGWINIRLMLDGLKQFFEQQHHYRTALFDYALLKQTDEGWQYQDFVADHIVFCGGYSSLKNPFFDAHIIPCKGDVLEFDSAELNITRTIKKGIYVVALGNGKFKCGSLYKWENDNLDLAEDDYNELVEKLTNLITVPFSITKQLTAIRPTTKNRELMVMTHPTLPHMHLLNGLGTKGVINGVKGVRQLIQTLNQ